VPDETVANYRQSTLAAFQQVEDALAALRLLEDEAGVQGAAVASAREAVRITTWRVVLAREGESPMV
jgi:outer membrane protein TolC